MRDSRDDRRPRGARALPRERRHRPLRRDRRRGAPRRDARAVGRPRLGKTYLTGGVGSRHYDESIGDAVRAAAGPRLLRDLRRDRQHHVELADAARHRRSALRRPARADALQRLPVRRSRSTAGRSSTSTRCSSRGGHGRNDVGPGCVLPAEHHAAARVAAPLPRDVVDGDGVQLHQYAPSTIRVRTDGGRSSCVDDRLSVGRDGRGRGRREPGRRSGRSSLRVPAWARGATLDGEEVAAGGYAEAETPLARRRPGRARARRLASTDRAEPADRRGARLPRDRARAARLLPRGDRPADGRRPRGRAASTRRPVEDAGPVEALDGFPGVAAAGRVRRADGWRQRRVPRPP